MKTEFVRKVMVIGIAMLIGIALCVSVWFLLYEHKAVELQEQNRPTGFSNEIAADNLQRLQPSQKSAGNPNEDPLTKKERVTQQASSMFMSSLSEEQLATPLAKKMLEAMNSPEYFALLESNFTERQWNDFLESQGVPVIRGHRGLFQKIIPNTELADYEPVVRRKLAELFISAAPVDLTDPVAAANQRSSVFLELGKELTQTDMATAAWIMERFGENWDSFNDIEDEGMERTPALEWMVSVQRNAASIVAAAETTSVDSPETQAAVPSWDMSSVIESSSAYRNETEMLTTPGISENAPMTNAEIEAAIEKSLTSQPREVLSDEHPDTPSGIPSNLETTLKAQFSSERFERAMDTLDQYGSEEGLRHLRENDPEVANQIERHRNRSRSEASDKSEGKVSK